jgi:uncharacterized membrane protein YphA (DoxX/SURF4 family)
MDSRAPDETVCRLFLYGDGMGKDSQPRCVRNRFAQWGIPYPAFNAALSAYTEFFGGALTILGLGMRFVPIPMIINMIVAILTVKLKNVSGLNDFAELDEPLYALSFVWLFFSGAGWLSVDGFLKHVINSWLHQDKSQGIAQAPIAETSLIETLECSLATIVIEPKCPRNLFHDNWSNTPRMFG